jgi:hypothetical protein
MGKKILLFLFISFFVDGFISENIKATEKETATKWQIVSKDDGIDVLERWIINEKNLKVKQRTGRMTLHCSASDVLNLISNAEKTPLWMKNAESVKRIKTINQNEWVVYTIIDTPWPFSRQDMVTKYKVIKLSSNIIKVKIEQASSLLPKKEDMDRLDTFTAEWVIIPTDKNTVKVSFTTLSTKPPKYPSWAQDPVVRRVFASNMRNFKHLLDT